MERIEKTYEIETNKNLLVDFTSENMGLKVIGWEQEGSEFHVKLDFEKTSDKEIGIDDFIKSDYDSKTNKIKIDVFEPEDIKMINSYLELKVPHITQLNAELENGGISIENLHGVQTVSTENGGIKMDHVNGDIECQAENGAILLQFCNGNENITSENGSVKLKNCDGSIKIKSENGVLKSVNCKGTLDYTGENGMIRITEALFSKVTIQTENGGIYYEFLPLEKGQFKISNKNGKIQLVIPDEIPYKIDARNKLGRFHVGLEGDYERREEGGEQVLEMTKGSGNVQIKVNNKQGSINFVNQPLKSRHFDFSSLGSIMDKAMDHIPDELDKEKIRKKMEKAKKKLKNIKIPDMEEINKHVSKAMEDVNKELKNLKVNVSADDFTEMADEKISGVVNTIHEKFVGEDLTEKQKNTIDERSRLKILQMLQEGKITAEEAEKLISTMEERDGR